MNAVFSYLSTQYNNVTFLSVDAEAHPEISETFDVSAVPFFVLIKNGKVVRELSGADPKELSAAIQELSGQQPAEAPTSSVENDAKEETTAEEDLNARLAKLVSAAPVMLFMKGTPAAPQCGFSRQLVGILRENQVR
jgi:thioredoxin-like negative regulator of GroEL